MAYTKEYEITRGRSLRSRFDGDPPLALHGGSSDSRPTLAGGRDVCVEGSWEAGLLVAGRYDERRVSHSSSFCSRTCYVEIAE
jgi:hypothetical protein